MLDHQYSEGMLNAMNRTTAIYSFGRLARLPLIAMVILLSACTTVGYYAQSIGGQLNLVLKARRIPVVLQDPATSQSLKDKLGTVLEIRGFASRELGLPENKSYTRYVDVRRPYLVWNVFAAPELSLDPVTWCFPVVGCVAYRGYFSKKAALEFAQRLANQGHDVYIGGVPAYSTLGWFSDPVPNTVMHYPDAELAGLIFHELSHQRYYIKDDTTFNESFATAVELEGVRRWRTDAADRSGFSSYELRRERDQQVMNILLRYKQKLSEIYQSEISDELKRDSKDNIFQELKQEYHRLVAGWEGYQGFARWFEQSLNNAHLISIAAYFEYLPAFKALILNHNGDLEGFYLEVESIGRLEPEARRARLHELMDETG